MVRLRVFVFSKRIPLAMQCIRMHDVIGITNWQMLKTLCSARQAARRPTATPALLQRSFLSWARVRTLFPLPLPTASLAFATTSATTPFASASLAVTVAEAPARLVACAAPPAGSGSTAGCAPYSGMRGRMPWAMRLSIKSFIVCGKKEGRSSKQGQGNGVS